MPVHILAICVGASPGAHHRLSGGLTTFSSFSAEVVGMLMSGRPGLAIATAALHVGGSLVLTSLGIRTIAQLAG